MSYDITARKGSEANPLTEADALADLMGTPRPLPVITPTISRKVWFWPSGARHFNGAPFDYFQPNQAMDATVVCVWGDRCVNLDVIDHDGTHHPMRNVILRQPGDPEPAGPYCEWMPFQVGQAKASGSGA